MATRRENTWTTDYSFGLGTPTDADLGLWEFDNGFVMEGRDSGNQTTKLRGFVDDPHTEIDLSIENESAHRGHVRLTKEQALAFAEQVARLFPKDTTPL